MPGLVRVLLARHPETLANVQRRFVGATDSPLSGLGERQAPLLAARIAAWRPDRVVSSPRARALAVARAAAVGCGVPLLVDDGLAECDFGEAEGLTFAEIQARGLALRAFAEHAPAGSRLTGEARTAVAERVALAGERATAAGGRVAVVTHGGVLRVLLRRWAGLPEAAADALPLPSATVLELAGTPGELAIVARDETLASLGAPLSGCHGLP